MKCAPPAIWLGLVAGLLSGASAQTVTLDNFNDPGAAGAVLAGTSWVNQVTRNASTITVGGNARDDSGWGRDPVLPSINAATMTHIAIIGQRDANNATTSLKIELNDSNLETIIVSIPTEQFALGTLTTVSVPVSWPAGFNRSAIARWTIGGGAAPTGLLAFRMTFDQLSLTGGVAPTPPTITDEPDDRAIGVGTGTTMMVAANANNSGTLRYQWKKGGAPIPNATSATLSLANTPLTASGLYSVDVTNDAGTTPSREARLTVLDARPTHALTPGNTGYRAGSAVTLTNTLTYSGNAPLLRWSVLLPDASGWSFASDTATTAATRPNVGAQSLLEWTWTTVPASPFTFTYTVNVPIGTQGDFKITAPITFTQDGVSAVITANPFELTVRNVHSRHSADTDGNLALSLFELTRVIELFNTRNGSVRTGAYEVATMITEDGYAAAPARAAGQMATLAHYHAADSNRDGMFNLFELTRAIQLYNFRNGSVRTGQYHVDPNNFEDGFELGP